MYLDIPQANKFLILTISIIFYVWNCIHSNYLLFIPSTQMDNRDRVLTAETLTIYR